MQENWMREGANIVGHTRHMCVFRSCHLAELRAFVSGEFDHLIVSNFVFESFSEVLDAVGAVRISFYNCTLRAKAQEDVAGRCTRFVRRKYREFGNPNAEWIRMLQERTHLYIPDVRTTLPLIDAIHRSDVERISCNCKRVQNAVRRSKLMRKLLLVSEDLVRFAISYLW